MSVFRSDIQKPRLHTPTNVSEDESQRDSASKPSSGARLRGQHEQIIQFSLRDDLIALDYLASRPEIDPEHKPGTGKMAEFCPSLPRQTLTRALAIGIGFFGLFVTALIAAIAVYAMRSALADDGSGGEYF